MENPGQIRVEIYRIVHPEHFGAAGNGTTNDTPSIKAASTWLKTKGGGVIQYLAGSNYLVDTNLVMDNGVMLLGPQFVGAFGYNIGDDMAFEFEDRKGRLILNTSNSIKVGMDCTLAGWIIAPKGMAFPQPNSAAWVGTAITIAGRDCEVMNNVIVGFDAALSASGKSRYKFDRNFIDCNRGIYCTGAFDVAWVSNNEGWPFASHTYTPAVGGAGEALMRSGAFIEIDGIDWGMLTNNFSWGYKIGHDLKSNSLHVSGGGADNANNVSSGVLHTDSIGLRCTATRTSIVGFKSAANAKNYQINAGSAAIMEITDCASWGPANSIGFELTGVAGGMISIGGLMLEGSDIGISCPNANVQIVNRGGHIFRGVATEWHTSGAATLGNFPIGGFLTNKASGEVRSSGLGIRTLASATALNIGHNGGDDEFISVSGTTQIQTIAGSYPSKKVTLVFQGACPVKHAVGGSDQIQLKGGADKTFAAGNVLMLRHTGGGWREVGN